MEKLQTVALEPSTNTHQAKGVRNLNVNHDHTAVEVEPNEAVVVHGQHKPLALEAKNVLVYRQNEYNPILKSHQKVID